jgi:4-hydroxybenzoate polyprenyltransferase
MAALTLAGAHFSHQPISWSVVCMVLLIAMFAMAWNDLYDRSVDRQKGKTYAWEHPRRVAALVVILAVASLFTVGIAFLFRKEFGYLGLVMWLSSALYPFLQTRPYIKNATVTLTVGATVLFPLCIQYCSAQWLLFGSLCLLTSARELLGDVDGVYVEQYCKRTAAMVWGVGRTKKVAAILLVGSSLVACVWPVFVLAALPVLIGAILLYTGKSYAVARWTLELGLLGWGVAAYMS